MKDKILAALKTKHADTIKSLGLGEKALQGIAAMLAITVTEEDQIETVVSSDGVEEALKGVQGEVDGRVTEAVKKAKAKKSEGGAGKETTTKKSEEGESDDETPAWAKGLTEKISQLSSELEAIKSEKTTVTLQQRIVDALKGKKVDEDYITDQLEGRTFDSEESAEAFIEKAEAGWVKLRQKFANEKLAEGSENSAFIATNEEGVSPFQAMLSASIKAQQPQKES